MLRLIKKIHTIIIRDIFVNMIASMNITPRLVRYAIYKIYGIKIHTKNIAPRCYMGGNKIYLGKGVYINYYVFFDNNGYIKIEDNCSIGMHVIFASTDHQIGNEDRRATKVIGKNIKVGNGTWIGAGAIILPGITIGRGCVIGAGAVVTKDCDPNCLYAGVPAKKIRNL